MHEPPPPDRTHTIARNARYGIWLFLIYVVFYAGFVAISAFKPHAMATNLAGVNLAIVYGMGLILLAFLLALVYMSMTGKDHASDSGGNNWDREGRA
jgi:uncharacterized membrane protein (DUF485 family)